MHNCYLKIMKIDLFDGYARRRAADVQRARATYGREIPMALPPHLSSVAPQRRRFDGLARSVADVPA